MDTFSLSVGLHGPFKTPQDRSIEFSDTTSAKNADLVKSLGADVIIDYKTQNFEQVLSGYDLVRNSQDTKTLEKSLPVLKPGGLLISISGPPDPAFAEQFGLNLS